VLYRARLRSWRRRLLAADARHRRVLARFLRRVVGLGRRCRRLRQCTVSLQRQARMQRAQRAYRAALSAARARGEAHAYAARSVELLVRLYEHLYLLSCCGVTTERRFIPRSKLAKRFEAAGVALHNAAPPGVSSSSGGSSGSGGSGSSGGSGGNRPAEDHNPTAIAGRTATTGTGQRRRRSSGGVVDPGSLDFGSEEEGEGSFRAGSSAPAGALRLVLGLNYGLLGVGHRLRRNPVFSAFALLCVGVGGGGAAAAAAAAAAACSVGGQPGPGPTLSSQRFVSAMMSIVGASVARRKAVQAAGGDPDAEVDTGGGVTNCSAAATAPLPARRVSGTCGANRGDGPGGPGTLVPPASRPRPPSPLQGRRGSGAPARRSSLTRGEPAPPPSSAGLDQGHAQRRRSSVGAPVPGDTPPSTSGGNDLDALGVQPGEVGSSLDSAAPDAQLPVPAAPTAPCGPSSSNEFLNVFNRFARMNSSGRGLEMHFDGFCTAVQWLARVRFPRMHPPFSGYGSGKVVCVQGGSPFFLGGSTVKLLHLLTVDVLPSPLFAGVMDAVKG
jgi:hypothetical protein